MTEPIFNPLNSGNAGIPGNAAGGPTNYGNRVDSLYGNCSDLRGSEQLAAFQEGIETSSPPGAEEGCQGHLAVGALAGAGAAADLATGYQMS